MTEDIDRSYERLHGQLTRCAGNSRTLALLTHTQQQTSPRTAARLPVWQPRLVVEAVLAGKLHGGVAAARRARARAVCGCAADAAEVSQLAVAQAALAHGHRQLPPAADGERLRRGGRRASGAAPLPLVAAGLHLPCLAMWANAKSQARATLPRMLIRNALTCWQGRLSGRD